MSDEEVNGDTIVNPIIEEYPEPPKAWKKVNK